MRISSRAVTAPIRAMIALLTMAALAFMALWVAPTAWAAPVSNTGDSADSPIRIGVVDGEEPYWTAFAEAAMVEGIYVDIQNFGDYTLLNQALVEGDLELNQFQHLDYLANFNVASGYDLVPVGATAVYPMALFSDRWNSVAEFPEGAEIAIPNDPTNLARALLVLQDAGLLVLNNGGSRQSTAYDVDTANSRVSVIPVDAAQTAASIHDLDGAIVNNDMIGQIGLSLSDAVYADNPESEASQPYINIFVARAADVDNPTFARLVSIFHNTPAVIDGLQEANANAAVIVDTPAIVLQQLLANLESQLRYPGEAQAVTPTPTATPTLEGDQAGQPAAAASGHGLGWLPWLLILPVLAAAGWALRALGLWGPRSKAAATTPAPVIPKTPLEEHRPATGAIGMVRPLSPHQTGKPIIRFQHVSKIFPATKRRAETRAVDDVTFDIYEGEVFAVIGYSGAGKSTLVRLINGLEKPTSGAVVIDGKDIAGLSESKLQPVRQEIGMVFQGFNLLQSRTVAGNVAYPLEVAGWPRAKRKERVAELLDYVGLSSMAGAYPNQLSGGQRQRVGIARALATNPKILLADEATSALDPETTQDVLRLLNQINTDLGITVVVITHSMSVVRFLCDRVAVMDHGQVAEIGDVYTVFGNPQAEITKRFVGTALADRPNAEVLERLRERHPGRLVTVNVREGSTKAFARIFSSHSVDAEVVFGGITEVGARPVGALTFEITGPPVMVDAAVAELLAQSEGEDYGDAYPAEPNAVPAFSDDAGFGDGAAHVDVVGDGSIFITDGEGRLR